MTAQEFLGLYQWETETTANLLGALTDASLAQEKVPGHMNAGQIAYHIATAATYMLNQCGYDLDPALAQAPEHLTSAHIQATYKKISNAVKEQTAGKTQAEMDTVHHVFGMFDWSLSMMLSVLLHHEIHHRGQLSVLMRQAGLVIPSIYGPTYEQTQEMKAKQAG